MERVWALPCLAWILNYLYPVFGEGRDDNSTISSSKTHSSAICWPSMYGNDVFVDNTEASSKPLPELPYRRSEWEKSVLYNLLIVVSPILQAG